jgi:DNA-binding protein HU-beta
MKSLQDKIMSAMNGPGDTAKLSTSAAKALKKATLAKAIEAKNLAIAKKQTAKVIPMKTPASKSAKKTTARVAAPVRKAAANKKVVRKTMKTGKKAKKRSR